MCCIIIIRLEANFIFERCQVSASCTKERERRREGEMDGIISLDSVVMNYLFVYLVKCIVSLIFRENHFLFRWNYCFQSNESVSSSGRLRLRIFAQFMWEFRRMNEYDTDGAVLQLFSVGFFLLLLLLLFQ